MIRSRTKRNGLQALADEYMEAHDGPVTSSEIAAWAMGVGKWRLDPSAALRICANEIADAMREDYITDPRGKSVRVKHAARFSRNGVQTTLWADMRTAPRRHMHIAFQQRRQQIVGDCKQLKLDVDSYNANWNTGAPIQMIFDFSDDLAEAEAAAQLRGVAA